jgi:hypothetical protein
MHLGKELPVSEVHGTEEELQGTEVDLLGLEV